MRAQYRLASARAVLADRPGGVLPGSWRDPYGCACVCAVVRCVECLNWAMEHDERFGLGRHHEGQRRQMRRAARITAQSTAAAETAASAQKEVLRDPAGAGRDLQAAGLRWVHDVRCRTLRCMGLISSGGWLCAVGDVRGRATPST